MSSLSSFEILSDSVTFSQILSYSLDFFPIFPYLFDPPEIYSDSLVFSRIVSDFGIFFQLFSNSLEWSPIPSKFFSAFYEFCSLGSLVPRFLAFSRIVPIFIGFYRIFSNSSDSFVSIRFSRTVSDSFHSLRLAYSLDFFRILPNLSDPVGI